MCFNRLFKKALLSCGTLDIHLASSILLDKLEEMGDNKAEVYLPDHDIKIYKRDDVVKFLDLDETDKIAFIAESMDCDDYAAILFGKFAGLIWTNAHALNFFISDEETLWFIEPQTDKLARDLEDWQGFDIRFFLGR